jgi:hypothetical protein
MLPAAADVVVVDIDDDEGAVVYVVGRKVLQAEIFYNYKCNQQNKITFVDKHLFFFYLIIFKFDSYYGSFLTQKLWDCILKGIS